MLTPEEQDSIKRISNTLRIMTNKGMVTKISIEWCAEDVLAMDDTLTANECEDVLTNLKKHHDASIGISWDTIRDEIRFLERG